MLLLLAAVFVCYAGTLNSGFIWDDNYLVSENSLLRAPIFSFQPFKQDIVNSSFTYTLYYRPIQILSYAIDYRIWGMEPFGFHLTNILFHFLNSLLLFFLVYKITKNAAISFLTSLFFVIHPAHVAAVAYVSGRADLLFFFFGMLTLLSFLYFRQKKKKIFLFSSVLFFSLAVLSKEYALIFLLIIPLMDSVLLRRGDRRYNAWPYLPFAIFALVYALFHYLFLANKYPLFFAPGNIIVVNFLRSLKVIGEFLILCVFPAGLHLRHSLSSETLFFGFQTTLIISAIILVLLSLRKSIKLLTFCLVTFFVCLIPFLFVLDSFNVYAEHWMYLPSAWLLLFVSAGLIGFFVRSSIKKKVLITIIIFSGITIYSKTCISQVDFFNDSNVLSDNVLKHFSEDKAALYFKSIDLYRRGKGEQASEQMTNSIKYYPSNPRLWYLKGRLELSLDHSEEAKYDFQKSLSINPRYANAYVGMALYDLSKNSIKSGINNLENAINYCPRHPEALMLLGMAYYQVGNIDKAHDTISFAIKVDPYGYDEIVNMGTVLTREGKIQEGGTLYLKAIKIYPKKPVPYYNLAYLFYLSGDFKNAKIYAQKTILLAPTYKPALDLLYKLRNDPFQSKDSRSL